MLKFQFRLHKVLEYRELVEEWAKEAYLDARARRLQAEIAITGIVERRAHAVRHRPDSVEDMMALERFCDRLDADQRAQESLVSLLEQEEEKARLQWLEKRTDAEAMRKLREAKLAEWRLETERAEQRELDEWAVTRRAA